jgi:hypothetical protein
VDVDEAWCDVATGCIDNRCGIAEVVSDGCNMMAYNRDISDKGFGT